MYTDLIRNKTNYSLSNPKTIIPKPTEYEYDTGFMNRYFCQRVNDKNGFVFEISSDTFGELEENPYWKTTIFLRVFAVIEIEFLFDCLTPISNIFPS